MAYHSSQQSVATRRLVRHEVKIDDIINILDIADRKQALDGYLFVACNLSVMPKNGQEINLAVVVDRQVRMDKLIHELVDLH